MSNNNQVYIRPLQLDDVGPLLHLRLKNRAFLELFEPVQNERHFTMEGQEEIVRSAITKKEEGSGYSFGIFLKETENLIGRVNLSNVVRGAWQSCTIGYFLNQESNGQGFMTQAVRLACQFAFEEAGLHRVQAAIMPHNIASTKVITKVGFHYEGTAKYYLNINGRWEDHKIYSLTKEYWP